MFLLNFLDATTLLVIAIVFCLSYYAFSEPKNLPPGPRAWPIVGNIFDLAANRDNFLDAFAQYAKQYGNIYRLKFGNMTMIMVNGYEHIHEALVAKSELFSDRPNFIWISQILKTGVIFANGVQWKELRKLILQALREFGIGKANIEEKVHDEINIILGILSSNEGRPVDMTSYLSMGTSNIICNIMFGSRFEYTDKRFKHLLECINQVVQVPPLFLPENGIPILRFLPESMRPSGKCIKLYAKAEEALHEFLEEHAATYDGEHLRDFVDLVIKNGSGNHYDCYKVQALLIDMFAAGSETSSTTLQWALLYMMAYPDVQVKCQEEIDRVIGPGRMVRYSDRSQLPYVEATICELQRISNIAPLTIPHTSLQDTTLGGYYIPKESIIIPNLMSVHMDPKLWPEPEVFNPDRFLNDRGEVIKKQYFMPFSIGPRVCAGENLARMELLLFFTNLLQSFTFTKPEGTNLDFKPCLNITRAPKAFKVVAVRR